MQSERERPDAMNCVFVIESERNLRPAEFEGEIQRKPIRNVQKQKSFPKMLTVLPDNNSSLQFHRLLVLQISRLAVPV